MREIKFRAWDNVSNKMLTDKEVCISPEGTTDSRLMQFTGLKDKNGKEIYEGDVLEIANPRSGSKNQRRLVEWVDKKRKSSIGYNTVKDIGFQFNPLKKGLGHNTIFETNECEVIGNIYESPELLT